MASYPIPHNEEGRLAALHRYNILDTPAEESFDRITRIAAAHFDVPISVISLVAEGRQWFKSCVGLDVSETGRDVSICAHTIMSDQVMAVEDASKDPRFADNPLVTGELNVRFYMGAPLRTVDGFNLGSLCVLGPEPRDVSDEQRAVLDDLSWSSMNWNCAEPRTRHWARSPCKARRSRTARPLSPLRRIFPVQHHGAPRR